MADHEQPADDDWAETTAPPPKKKGIPGWLMFCGGGCLIAMILGAIGTFFLVGEVKKAMDPEAQWARLEEAFEIEGRPTELTPMFGVSLGMDFWMFQDSRGYVAVIYDFGESQAEGRDELFSEDFTGGGVPGLSKIEDPTVAEVLVQGRALPVVHFQNQGGFNAGGSEVNGQGGACFVDITPEDSLGFQMVFLMRDPGQGNASNDPIPDQAIQDFLEPFVIGPERETYVSPPREGVQTTLELPEDE